MISPHQKSRNNARSPLYFAVARVHSRPWMITFPLRSHTRHSQRFRPRFAGTTSNVTPTIGLRGDASLVTILTREGAGERTSGGSHLIRCATYQISPR